MPARAESGAAARPWHWPFESKRLYALPALRAALVLLALGVAVRVLLASALWLSDDEAWYWALSERLDVSYVVHPPLSVWLVRLSTALLGHNVLAVRLPAILCAALGTFWLVRLVSRMGWAKGAHVTAALCLTAPILFVGGILGGPDLPLFTFWAAMMEKSYALGTGDERKLSSWLLLGLYAGLALLSKYTAVLGIAAAGLWFLATPTGRRALRTPGPYVALLVAALLFLPVVGWNALNDWSSFRFQFLARHEGGQLNLKRYGLFWLSQLFAFGPPVVYCWFRLQKRLVLDPLGPRLPQDARSTRFLAIWALVPALVFFAQPLYSDFKIHWALFAFIPVLAYFAKLAASNVAPRLVRHALAASLALTLIGLVALFVPVAGLATKFAGKKALDPRFDATNDFYGWDSLKEKLAELPDDVRELPLVATRYQVAAQAAFALGDKERVAILPHDSYELRDWGGLETAPQRFLYVSDNRYGAAAREAFPMHECEPVLRLQAHRLGGLLAKEIRLDLCETFGTKPNRITASSRD